jgi:hypothetical protein
MRWLSGRAWLPDKVRREIVLRPVNKNSTPGESSFFIFDLILVAMPIA